MGYQSRNRSPGSSGRGHKVLRRKKAKVKVEKRQPRGVYAPEEDHVRTSEEILAGILNRLHSLGNQRFALSPFSGYFGPWLGTVRDAMVEFESIPTIGVDDKFLKERSQIISNVELELEERRREEASMDKISKSLSGNRVLLERVEEKHNARTMETEKHEANEIKRLSTSIEGVRKELDRIAQIKTGFFRRVSEKAKAQKEAEATQRLDSAQKELTLAVQHFSAEKEKIRKEYEDEKRPLIEQIGGLQKEVEKLEIDGSVEARRAACEALVDAVNAFVERKRLSLQKTS